MSDVDKHQLLKEFADFLEQKELDMPDILPPPDLYSLLTEMAGLKAEVKAESRHLKTMLDHFSAALETLKADNTALTGELHHYQKQLVEQKRNIEYETQRKIILELLDVYDRLAAGAALVKKYKPVNSFLNHSKKQDQRFIKSIYQGQKMSINRLQQLLQSHHVNPIETVGKILDPHSMTAVATVNNKHIPQGRVVEEIRKGFYFENSVLRHAEVKVNKLSE